MQGQSEALDEWLDAIVDRYFYGSSWPQMVIKSGTVDKPIIVCSEWDARFVVKRPLHQHKEPTEIWAFDLVAYPVKAGKQFLVET